MAKGTILLTTAQLKRASRGFYISKDIDFNNKPFWYVLEPYSGTDFFEVKKVKKGWELDGECYIVYKRENLSNHKVERPIRMNLIF